MSSDAAPGMAVRRFGQRPDLASSTAHGVVETLDRNVEPLAARFNVHALDHPSYGDSRPSLARDDGSPISIVYGLRGGCCRATRPCGWPGFVRRRHRRQPGPRLGPRVTTWRVSPGGFRRGGSVTGRSAL